MNQMQHDKIRGVLYGVAVGDALGAPVEFMSAESIKAEHGRVTEMLGGGWLNVSPGEVTDDTQMTLCVARGIRKNPKAPVEDIGVNFIDWACGGPKDIGATCALSITKAQKIGMESGRLYRPSYSDWMQASNEADKAMGGRSAGNGSLMRTAYVPCFYYDENEIMERAIAISTMTHYSEEAAEACVFYCRTIARMLNRKTHGTRLNVFRREVRNSEYKIALDPGFKPNPTGYVRDSLLAAIWSIQQGTRLSTDFYAAVEAAVNLGGDADTIGAITGGLAGALCGYNKIPERWVTKLSESLREELDSLAYAAEEAREQAKRELDNAARR